MNCVKYQRALNEKKLLLIPLVLLLISLTASISAFKYTKELEFGFISVDNEIESIIYNGHYYAIVGNIEEKAKFIAAESLLDGIYVRLYDNYKNAISTYLLVIRVAGSPYSKDSVTTILWSDKVLIDDLDDTILTVLLSSENKYEMLLIKTGDGSNQDSIDLILINMPEQLLNRKTLSEGIAFTTPVFSLLSFITIIAVYFLKKE